jgi:hypothetical protein
LTPSIVETYLDEQNVGSRFSQRERHLFPDPSRPAGDESSLALQTEQL